jgi:hypothetical protein
LSGRRPRVELTRSRRRFGRSDEQGYLILTRELVPDHETKGLRKRLHGVQRTKASTLRRASKDGLRRLDEAIRKMAVPGCEESQQSSRTLPAAHRQFPGILTAAGVDTTNGAAVIRFLGMPHQHDLAGRHCSSPPEILVSVWARTPQPPL